MSKPEKRTSKGAVALLVLVAALAMTAIVVTVTLLFGDGGATTGADVLGIALE